MLVMLAMMTSFNAWHSNAFTWLLLFALCPDQLCSQPSLLSSRYLWLLPWCRCI